jgi:hypothetical protein
MVAKCNSNYFAGPRYAEVRDRRPGDVFCYFDNSPDDSVIPVPRALRYPLSLKVQMVWRRLVEVVLGR